MIELKAPDAAGTESSLAGQNPVTQEKLITALKALHEAAQAIASDLSLESVLQKIVQAARNLLKARYAALGIHDGQGKLSRFIAAGLSPADQAKIGPLPAGRGLLGLLLRQGQSLIINDITHHPAAVGFPAHHPPMSKLLGVPIFSKEVLVGALYLADKEDGSDFTQTDQELIETLALHAAIAIENARLYEKTERMAVLEERERFARDLHDGLIQSIYAVGLSLENIKAGISPVEEALQAKIDLSLKSLNAVINDLRSYIFDLRPQALSQRGLQSRLSGLIKEVQTSTLLPLQTEIDPTLEPCLNDQQVDHIFYLCHEGLSNAARHARASHISLSLTRTGDMVTLRIEDDGIGFEPPTQIIPGHRGLTNMQARVSQLKGTFKLDSAPQQGTRLSVTFPCALRP